MSKLQYFYFNTQNVIFHKKSLSQKMKGILMSKRLQQQFTPSTMSIASATLTPGSHQ
jgi:hypothetical protein